MSETKSETKPIFAHPVAEDSEGRRVLLSGNEAVARGAIEAGVKVASSYAGSPSTEIMETLALVAPDLGFHAEWSTNEKVAFDLAAGAAVVGVRSFTSMKNAGLAWCVDMFTTVTYNGVRGGFVICVSDDPGARISGNAHDSRTLGMDAKILVLEPADHQEAKDMTKLAFELSEQTELPVLVRSQYRISYSSGDVVLGKIEANKKSPVFDRHWKMPFRWSIYGLGQNQNRKQGLLHAKQQALRQIAEELPYTKLDMKKDRKLGLIVSGAAHGMTKEVLGRLRLTNKVSILKTGTAYPLAEDKVARLLKHVKNVGIIEDGPEPVIEQQVRAFAQDVGRNVKIYGRTRNQVLPSFGDLDLATLEKAITKVYGIKHRNIYEKRLGIKNSIRKIIPPRSLNLCAGCPHTATWWAIRVALRGHGGKVPIINGDIGCHAQAGFGVASRAGEYNPSFSTTSVRYDDPYLYEILDTNNAMGGGISFAQGQYWAEYKDGKVIAVTGDSAFFHACLPALVNMAWNKPKFLLVVFDNIWTAMTGTQPNPGTGLNTLGEKTEPVSIEEVCKAVGVKYVRTIDPYDVRNAQKAITEALDYEGPAVVVARRLCALEAVREKQLGLKTYEVLDDRCNGCKVCLRLGCPSIAFDFEKKKARIIVEHPYLSCVGCDVCSQICPMHAMVPQGEGK